LIINVDFPRCTQKAAKIYVLYSSTVSTLKNNANFIPETASVDKFFLERKKKKSLRNEDRMATRVSTMLTPDSHLGAGYPQGSPEIDT